MFIKTCTLDNFHWEKIMALYMKFIEKITHSSTSNMLLTKIFGDVPCNVFTTFANKHLEP